MDRPARRKNKILGGNILKLEKGGILIYGVHGICRVEDVRTEIFGQIKGEYYVLRPVYEEKETIYLPVQNEKLLSKVTELVSPEDILELVSLMPSEKDWIEDDRKRNDNYQKILEERDRTALAKTVKGLELRKQEMEKQGKRLHVWDEEMRKKALKMLYEEISLIFDLERKDLVGFLFSKVQVPVRSLLGAEDI